MKHQGKFTLFNLEYHIKLLTVRVNSFFTYRRDVKDYTNW